MASIQLASACRQIGRLFGQGTVAGLGEGQLLDRFVERRDADAFAAIVARHGPTVLAACRALLRDPNDVDDAFQATFLVLVKRADSLRRRDLLGPWLHGVARRVAMRARAESARRRDRLAILHEPAGSDGADLGWIDDRAAIHAEVDRLPATYRAAIVLCYLEGRTHEEAAQELGWPVGTVRGRLARARDLLRGRLMRRGIGITPAALAAALAREAEAAVPGVLLESTTKAAALAATGPLATLLASSAIVSSRALALAQGVLPAMTASKLKLAATLVVVGLIVGPGASAHPAAQVAGPSTAKAQDGPRVVAAPEVTKPEGTAAPVPDRVAIAERVLREQIRLFEQGEISAEGIDRWNRRLLAARIESGLDRAEAFLSFVETSRTIESIARTLYTKGEATQTALTAAQSDRMEAEDYTRQVWHLPPGPIVFPLVAGDAPSRREAAKADPSARPAGAGPGLAAPTPAEPQPPEGGPEERLKMAEEAIATLQALHDSKESKSNAGFRRDCQNQLSAWQGVADQARRDLGTTEPASMVALRALEAARASEARIKKEFESGEASQLGYLDARLRRVKAEHDVEQQARHGAVTPAVGPPAGADAGKAKPGPDAGVGPMARGGGLLDGGAIAGAEPIRPRRLPKPNPADADRDKAIEQALEQTVSLSYPVGTPLDEILRSIRDRTKDEKAGLKKGIPIYVDPIVLIEDVPGQDRRAKALATLVPIEVDELPLRVALRLVLDQFALSYQVRDRMVYVIDEDLLDFRSEGAVDFMKANGLRTGGGGMVGGMGGMGGGMGSPGGMGGGMGGMRGGMGGMM